MSMECSRWWGREDKRGHGWKGSLSPRTIARALETQYIKRKKSNENNRSPLGTSSSSQAHGLCICSSISFYHLLALHRAGSFLSFISSIKYHFLQVISSNLVNSSSIQLLFVTLFLSLILRSTCSYLLTFYFLSPLFQCKH